jgi:hypothetical protein
VKDMCLGQPRHPTVSCIANGSATATNPNGSITLSGTTVVPTRFNLGQRRRGVALEA